MIDYKQLQFNDPIVYKKRGRSRNRITSDTIYTLDIETTSLFKINDEWRSFDYTLSPKDYQFIEKISIPYIFMFGVENVCYYGRNFYDLDKIFKQISDNYIHKVIWVHNLSFEMFYLLDILKNYTIENMIARDILKPISFYIKELNLTFRCSYMLTNMSLERSAKEYGTVFKKSGDLDYNMTRGSKTVLSDQEMEYCEYDILSLHSIIDHFRKQYKHIACIPLTCTGEVRLELREHLDYFYYNNYSWRLVPSKEIYLKLMAIFAGGYTHANALNANRIIHDVNSYDIASSYPTVMCLEKFPCQEFKRYTYDRYLKLKNRSYAFFFLVHFKKCRSKYYTNYISHSKIFDQDEKTITVDNGRVVSGEDFKMWLTDVDMEIIIECYECDYEYLEIYGAYKDYLDVRVIKYILELYNFKTTLKGIPEKEDIYKRSKSRINALFGMGVTNPLKNGASFTINEGWKKIDFNDSDTFDEFVDETLEKQKHSFSNLFYFAVGVWITAYARRNVLMTALKMDSDLIYIDTDSIKCKGDHADLFDAYNKEVERKYNECVKHFRGQIKIKDFYPVDKKGVKHPLGFFEKENNEPIQEFITIGAKKYCYRDESGLHLTVAGVNKSRGVTALNDDINNFKRGFTFDYEHSGKLTHIYMYDQPQVDFYDYKGVLQHSNQQHGVVLQPTTYTLGLTDSYDAIIRYFQDLEVRK